MAGFNPGVAGIAAFATALSSAVKRRRENALLELKLKQQQDDMAFRQAAQREQQRQREETERWRNEGLRLRQREFDARQEKDLADEYEAPIRLQQNQAPYTAADLAPVMGKGREYARAPDSASFVTDDVAPEGDDMGGPVITFDESKPSKDMLLEDRANALAAAGRTAQQRASDDRDAKSQPKPNMRQMPVAAPKPIDPKYGDQLASTVATAAMIQNTADRAGELGRKYPGYLKTRLSDFAMRVGVDDPEVRTFIGQARANVSAEVKDLSGTAASDEERNFIKAQMPSEDDTLESLKMKADNVSWVKRYRMSIRLKGQRASGRDVSQAVKEFGVNPDDPQYALPKWSSQPRFGNTPASSAAGALPSGF